MDKIRQIFMLRRDLEEEDEVQELIDHCRELEDQVYDLDDQGPSDRELAMLQFIRELDRSCKDIVDDEEVDEEKKEYVKNLKNYIEEFRRDNSV